MSLKTTFSKHCFQEENGAAWISWLLDAIHKIKYQVCAWTIHKTPTYYWWILIICSLYRNRGPMLRGSQPASGSTTHNTVTTQSFRWANVNDVTRYGWSTLRRHSMMFVYFSTLKSPSETVWYIVTKIRGKWLTRTQRRPREENPRTGWNSDPAVISQRYLSRWYFCLYSEFKSLTRTIDCCRLLESSARMAAPTWGRWPSSSPALTTWSWTRSATSPTSSRSRPRSPWPAALSSTMQRPAPSRLWWGRRESKGMLFISLRFANCVKFNWCHFQ